MYDIPGDTGHPWRWQKYLEYHALGDADMNFPVLCKWADMCQLTRGQRIWMSLVYSACYCVPTTIFIMRKFPTIVELNHKDLEKFWEVFKPAMIFQSDRKYVKNMNWFIPIVMGFKQAIDNKPVAWAKSLMRSTPSQTYMSFYKHIIKWQYFGRFSTFLMVEALSKLAHIEMDTAWFDWKNGNTATEGMLHLLYMDDLADQFKKTPSVVTPELVNLLTAKLAVLRSDIAKKYPAAPTALDDVETSLCGFRKLFKQSRYGGYYIDRQQEEIQKMAKVVNSPAIFELRKQVFPNHFLGELNGWSGIRKELNRQWIMKGLTGVESFS